MMASSMMASLAPRLPVRSSQPSRGRAQSIVVRAEKNNIRDVVPGAPGTLYRHSQFRSTADRVNLALSLVAAVVAIHLSK